jgi:hypothetical protein
MGTANVIVRVRVQVDLSARDSMWEVPCVMILAVASFTLNDRAALTL